MGRYDDAEQVLGANSAIDTPATLDLQARIRAQQGRLVEAQTLWSEAVRLDPNNESYRAGLQRLTSMNRRSWWGFISKDLVRAAVAALIVLALALAWRRSWQQERTELLTEVRTALQPAQKAGVQDTRLQVQGVSQRVQGHDLVLRFDSGLFGRADVLTPQARAVLMEVGQQLQPLANKSTICVVGYSDDLPLTTHIHFRDNQMLALARAHAVAVFLASSMGMPGRRFSLQGGEGSIYPNNTAKDRARNRSVEIFISK
jgi:type VI secretion system protein ImpK